MWARFQARQLANPSGLAGRLLLAPLWNRRNAALNDAAFARLALEPHDRVLEVGFGGGYLLGCMAAVVSEGLVAGVDASPAMVAYCERRFRGRVGSGHLELRCAPAEDLPYATGCFSHVCSVNSLFYWHDAPRALAEMHRVLAPRGRLVLCFTCRESLQKKAFSRHGVAAYELDEVVRMLQVVGFGRFNSERLADRHRSFWCVRAERP